MFREVVNSILYIIGLLIVGYVLGVYFSYKSLGHSPNNPITMDSTLVNSEAIKIDSLENVIREYEKINSSLRDSVRIIEVTRTIEVDAIKKLPLDSGVLYLKQRLREFQ